MRDRADKVALAELLAEQCDECAQHGWQSLEPHYRTVLVSWVGAHRAQVLIDLPLADFVLDLRGPLASGLALARRVGARALLHVYRRTTDFSGELVPCRSFATGDTSWISDAECFDERVETPAFPALVTAMSAAEAEQEFFGFAGSTLYLAAKFVTALGLAAAGLELGEIALVATPTDDEVLTMLVHRPGHSDTCADGRYRVGVRDEVPDDPSR